MGGGSMHLPVASAVGLRSEWDVGEKTQSEGAQWCPYSHEWGAEEDSLWGKICMGNRHPFIQGPLCARFIPILAFPGASLNVKLLSQPGITLVDVFILHCSLFSTQSGLGLPKERDLIRLVCCQIPQSLNGFWHTKHLVLLALLGSSVCSQ